MMGRRLQRKRQASFPICVAVVPTAGHAAWMGGRDKLLEPLGGQPVLVHTLRALDNCPLIAEICSGNPPRSDCPPGTAVQRLRVCPCKQAKETLIKTPHKCVCNGN